jgi:hypothetical protein
LPYRPIRPFVAPHRATTPAMLARVTALPDDDRIGLAEQIAAVLLPEADDSCVVEGGEAL